MKKSKLEEIDFPENPFPGRMKMAMEKKKITRWELAKKTDLKLESIYGYLYGRVIPRADSLKKVSEVLEVTMDWLYV